MNRLAMTAVAAIAATSLAACTTGTNSSNTNPTGAIKARAVTWLLSDAASFVTGCAMPVDGGMTAQ